MAEESNQDLPPPDLWHLTRSMSGRHYGWKVQDFWSWFCSCTTLWGGGGGGGVPKLNSFHQILRVIVKTGFKMSTHAVSSNYLTPLWKVGARQSCKRAWTVSVWPHFEADGLWSLYHFDLCFRLRTRVSRRPGSRPSSYTARASEAGGAGGKGSPTLWKPDPERCTQRRSQKCANPCCVQLFVIVQRRPCARNFLRGSMSWNFRTIIKYPEILEWVFYFPPLIQGGGGGNRAIPANLI